MMAEKEATVKCSLCGFTPKYNVRMPCGHSVCLYCRGIMNRCNQGTEQCTLCYAKARLIGAGVRPEVEAGADDGAKTEALDGADEESGDEEEAGAHGGKHGEKEIFIEEGIKKILHRASADIADLFFPRIRENFYYVPTPKEFQPNPYSEVLEALVDNLLYKTLFGQYGDSSDSDSDADESEETTEGAASNKASENIEASNNRSESKEINTSSENVTGNTSGESTSEADDNIACGNSKDEYSNTSEKNARDGADNTANEKSDNEISNTASEKNDDETINRDSENDNSKISSTAGEDAGKEAEKRHLEPAVDDWYGDSQGCISNNSEEEEVSLEASQPDLGDWCLLPLDGKDECPTTGIALREEEVTGMTLHGEEEEEKVEEKLIIVPIVCKEVETETVLASTQSEKVQVIDGKEEVQNEKVKEADEKVEERKSEVVLGFVKNEVQEANGKEEEEEQAREKSYMNGKKMENEVRDDQRENVEESDEEYESESDYEYYYNDYTDYYDEEDEKNNESDGEIEARQKERNDSPEFLIPKEEKAKEQMDDFIMQESISDVQQTQQKNNLPKKQSHNAEGAVPKNPSSRQQPYCGKDQAQGKIPFPPKQENPNMPKALPSITSQVHQTHHAMPKSEPKNYLPMHQEHNRPLGQSKNLPMYQGHGRTLGQPKTLPMHQGHVRPMGQPMHQGHGRMQVQPNTQGNTMPQEQQKNPLPLQQTQGPLMQTQQRNPPSVQQRNVMPQSGVQVPHGAGVARQPLMQTQQRNPPSVQQRNAVSNHAARAVTPAMAEAKSAATTTNTQPVIAYTAIAPAAVGACTEPTTVAAYATPADATADVGLVATDNCTTSASTVAHTITGHTVSTTVAAPRAPVAVALHVASEAAKAVPAVADHVVPAASNAIPSNDVQNGAAPHTYSASKPAIVVPASGNSCDVPAAATAHVVAAAGTLHAGTDRAVPSTDTSAIPALSAYRATFKAVPAAEEALTGPAYKRHKGDTATPGSSNSGAVSVASGAAGQANSGAQVYQKFPIHQKIETRFYDPMLDSPMFNHYNVVTGFSRSSTSVFFDLGFFGVVQGTVQIEFLGDSLWSQQLIQFCTEQDRSSRTRIHAHTNRSQRDEAIEIVWETTMEVYQEHLYTIMPMREEVLKRGLVWGSCLGIVDGKPTLGFSIMMGRGDDEMSRDVFGKVISGMEFLRCTSNAVDICRVKIIDCGLGMRR